MESLWSCAGYVKLCSQRVALNSVRGSHKSRCLSPSAADSTLSERRPRTAPHGAAAIGYNIAYRSKRIRRARREGRRSWNDCCTAQSELFERSAPDPLPAFLICECWCCLEISVHATRTDRVNEGRRIPCITKERRWPKTYYQRAVHHLSSKATAHLRSLYRRDTTALVSVIFVNGLSERQHTAHHISSKYNK